MRRKAEKKPDPKAVPPFGGLEYDLSDEFIRKNIEDYPYVMNKLKDCRRNLLSVQGVQNRFHGHFSEIGIRTRPTPRSSLRGRAGRSRARLGIRTQQIDQFRLIGFDALVVLPRLAVGGIAPEYSQLVHIGLMVVQDREISHPRPGNVAVVEEIEPFVQTIAIIPSAYGA